MDGKYVEEVLSGLDWGSSVTFTLLDYAPNYYDLLDPDVQGFRTFHDTEMSVRGNFIGTMLGYVKELTNLNLVSQQQGILEDGTDVVGDITFAFGDGEGEKQKLPPEKRDLLAGFNGEVWEDPNSNHASQQIGDVWIVNHGPADNDTLAFLAAALHEFGHALGLKHVGHAAGADAVDPIFVNGAPEDSAQFTIMSYALHPGLNVNAMSFQLLDIAALQYLYGADYTTRKEATTYDTDTYFKDQGTGIYLPYCIWDGGGIDTLSAEGATASAIIDLREGRFSSIIDDPKFTTKISADNVSIAFNCQIENAEGSNKDDVIIGNYLDNKLEGKEGNDTIYGSGNIDDSSAGEDAYLSNAIYGRNTIASYYKYRVNDENLASGDDLLLGEGGNDKLWGGKGSDVFYGGRGDDWIKGGDEPDPDKDDDVDAAKYEEDGTGAIVVHLDNADGKITIDDGFSGYDELYEIELIVGTHDDDTVRLTTADLKQYSDLEVDLADNTAQTDCDTLDLSKIVASMLVDLRNENAQTASVVDQQDKLKLKHVEAVTTGGGDDVVLGGATTCIIRTGSGEDEVNSISREAQIDLGEGDDRLANAGAGSIVYTGTGHDLLNFSAGVQVDDADGFDRVIVQGLTLFNAFSNAASESIWSYFDDLGGLARSAYNSVGQLGVQDIVSMAREAFAEEEPGAQVDENDYTMFFSHFNSDPMADLEHRTAGIRLADIAVSAYQLMKGPSPEQIELRNETSTWELMAQMLQDLDKLKNVDTCSTDPLALDLDGDGLELSSRTGLAPYFDVDGDGFLERTGWVRGDDGLLVADANSNGKVDGFSELFGSPTASGFIELKTYDINNDGKVDSSDSGFASLMVWQDKDADGVTDAGELRTLTELGITAISVTATDVTKTNTGNTIAAEGAFTRSDGSTGTISDVRFDANQYDSKYAGDNSVDPTIAATMPNLKGHGTLANLQVALTQNPTGALASAIAAALPTLDTLDITELRDRALPILQAWAQAPLDGVPPLPGGANPDIVVLVDRSEVRTQILNFAMQVTETVTINGAPEEVTYWKLASGQAHDAQSNVIQYPTLAEVLAQVPGDPDQDWDVMPGTTLDFLERYFGANIPFDDADLVQGGAVGSIAEFLEKGESAVELLSIRLAMQGPLAPYFEGVSYDVAEDCFRPTTDRQLTPMFEAIFEAAPGSESSTTDWLEAWQPILDNVILDYERGPSNLVNSYAFIFTCIVAAYENVGLDLGVKPAAVALGLPGDLIDVGSGVRVGTDENDIFYMGAGDDTAKGGIGPDTYVFGKNFGHDVIDDVEQGANDCDQIRFAHLTQDDVTAYRDGRDLKLVVNATGETVLVKDEFYEILPSLLGNNTLPIHGVEEIIFADGTVWDRMTIALKVSHPEDGDQTLIGTDQVDVLDGGKGNDTLIGGNNSDVYVFGTEYGQDVIDDQAGDHNILILSNDVLMFKDGITREDVTFSRGTDVDDLIITINGTDDQVRINNEFTVTYAGSFGAQWMQRIEYFNFANGEQVSWEDLIQQFNHDAKTDGDDTIIGFSYADTLDGGKGNDYLSGGNESDTYIFDFGYGHDVVDDNLTNIFSGDNDRVLFGADVKASDVTFSRVGATDDLLVTLSDGSTITVHDQFDTELTGVIHFDQVERFEFASDPNATIYSSLIYDMLLQSGKTAGDDTIYGFDRNDTIDGGAGNDTLAGSNGSDTYLFGKGSGNDLVVDTWDSIFFDDVDKVLFGAGITLTDLEFGRIGDDLTVTIKATGETLRIEDQLQRPNTDVDGVEKFQFADGSVLDEADIRQLIQHPTSGNDSLYGTDWGEVFEGGAGNDYIQGEGGGDLYRFNLGDGQDTIYDYELATWYADPDRIEFGAGIKTGDVTLQHVGDDLIISINGTSDSIKVVDHFDSTYARIEELAFADGTVWHSAEIVDAILAGASGANDTLYGDSRDNNIAGKGGNDVLYGADGHDTLDGGAGNDSLQGDAGGDTYVFGKGYGRDVVEEDDFYGAGTETDILKFNADVQVADVTLSRAGFGSTDLVLSILDSTDSITLTDYFGASRYHIEQVQFADGTKWDYQTVLGMVLQGTAGDDTLIGTAGANLLDGGAGNDLLKGGDGSDTYVFGKGYGSDTVSDTPGGTDTLLFNADTTPADVIVSRSTGEAEDLVLQIAGTADKVLIDGYFAGSTRIEYVKFADGTVWNYDSIMLKVLAGTDGDDLLIGNSGANVLDGGKGNDTLQGAEGSDTYAFGIGYGADLIDDYDFFNTGSDTLKFGAGITAADVQLYALGDDMVIRLAGRGDALVIDSQMDSTLHGIETFQFADGTTWSRSFVAGLFIAGTSGADTLNGTANNDVIDGGSGNDTMSGGAGSDTYIVNASGDAVQESASAGNDLVRSAVTYTLGTNLEDLMLTGFSGISGTGNTAANRIIGNDSNNTLDGKEGADLLIGGLGSDTYYVDDLGDQVIEYSGGGTADTVNSAVDWTLATYVEHLTLTGSANASGTGNALDNTIAGNGGDNTIQGGAGNDTLTGAAGNDVLVGGDGNDALNGGTGNDTLTGGAGNDSYTIDSTNDVIAELSNEGIDSVQSSATFTLSAGVENLTLTGSSGIGGTGNALDNIITGNSGANALTGGDGNDTLTGGGGNDTLTGGDGNDTLYGQAGEDAYIGAAGDDWLVADVGTDTFDGGDGNDTGDFRYLTSATTLDLVNNAPGETLTSIENLYSGSGNDTLSGNAVDNYINGGAGNDTINGRDGNDTLDGAAGNDKMSGGTGNDTYVLDAAGDTVTENANEGVDTVQSAVAHTLGANVENLTLTGTNAVNGTGNTLGNILTGNSGANLLAAGDGDDALEGGAGTDTLQGGNGNDSLRWDASDVVDGGAGRDTLLYADAGDLDFDAVNVSNIEAINLGVNDNNNNGVALSLADILSLAATSSGTGLSANGDNVDLFVFGDNEGAVVDNVTLTGGWTANGTITTAEVTGANTTFMLYVAGTSQVAVQQDLDVAAA